MPLAPYTGLVATRCLAPVSRNTTNKQLMSRSPHYTRVAVTSLQIVIPNWYVDTTTRAETGTGDDASVTASIEYPANTFTQILFSGVSTGTVPDGGQLLSDAVSVTIPNNTLFWVRIWWDGGTGGVLTVAHDLTGTGLPGAGLEVGVSGITDETMSGTVTAADNEFSPVAIIGSTTRPSFVIIGDSIGLGDSTRETTGDASGDFGTVARSLGPKYAYASYCQNGDRAASFIASHTNRESLFQYASHLACEYGNNDLFVANAGASTVIADLTTIAGYMTARGGEAWQTTITPRSSSTDSYATVENQSLTNGTVEPRRDTVNAAIRSLGVGNVGYFDIASAVEPVLDGGLWKVTGSANGYTEDGVHPNTAGSILIRDSGVVALAASEGSSSLLTLGV